jgi:uncharacterized protein YjaG (DUF416 family)
MPNGVMIMPKREPKTLDEYERLVATTLATWSAPQRLAFVATLAERWLEAYEKFSAKEQWGDAAALRQIVGIVWDQLAGRPGAPADHAQLLAKIQENTPDTEKCDGLPAWRALQACLILGHALRGLESPDDVTSATRAALAGFEAAIGDWPSDISGQRRAWKKVPAQEEFRKQSALLEQIGSMSQFDDPGNTQLRRGLETTKPKRTQAKAKSKKVQVDDDSIDGWRSAVHGYSRSSPGHRIAFAAALAQRLFPLYEAFAARTGKGRPDLMRGVLENIWQSATGQLMTSDTVRACKVNLQEAAPGLDEPGAWDAWSAWRVLELALQCCTSVDNAEPAGEAAVVAYERVAGRDARKDPQIWKQQLRLPELYDETMKQMSLLMRLKAAPEIGPQLVESLRPKSS